MPGPSKRGFRKTLPMDHKCDPLERESEPLDQRGENGASEGLAAALGQIEHFETNHTYQPLPVDVARLRKKMGMTQTQFARRF